MRTRIGHEIAEEDLKNIESLDFALVNMISNETAPEFFALLRLDYAVRGSIDFADASIRESQDPIIRQRAFTALIVQTAKHFALKRKHLAFYRAEESGRSGKHFHYHFGIADHEKLHGKEDDLAHHFETVWGDGIFLPDGPFVKGRCRAQKFDNSRKAEAILYDCKRDPREGFIKEPFISKELLRRLQRDIENN
jgi:hypothetical protein